MQNFITVSLNINHKAKNKKVRRFVLISLIFYVKNRLMTYFVPKWCFIDKK